MNELILSALSRAEGYLELDLTNEAWAALDDLPIVKPSSFPRPRPAIAGPHCRKVLAEGRDPGK